MATLTEMVVDYQHTGRGFEKVANRIAAEVYAFPANRNGFDEDDCGEFLLFFYPRIRRLVEHFVPRGTPFEHYLKRTLRWQLKSYAISKRTSRARQSTEKYPGLWAEFQQIAAPYDGVPSEQAEEVAERLYCSDSHFHRDNRPSVAEPECRRMVILALKGCTAMDDGQIKRIADEIGISPLWLARQRDRLREVSRCKQQRLDTLRQRRNVAYATVVQLQGELCRTIEPERRHHLLKRIEIHTRRLIAARSLLSRVPRRPTNVEIAAILDIPKGTVDSTLYYLRKRYNISLEESPRVGHTRHRHGTTTSDKQSTQTAGV